jgi:MoaA/NifB/PqqE/SkfB family radical SAM enzyme
MLLHRAQKDYYGPVQGIEMKLTSECNYKCDFCSNKDGVPIPGERIKVNEISEALRELVEADSTLSNLNEIYFTGGEPLLALNHLIGIAEILPKSVSINISTNGLLLDELALDRLLKVGLKGVKLSYDTVDPRKLPEIRAGATSSDLGRIETNIRSAVRKGVAVYLRSTVGRQNIDELSEIYARAGILGAACLQIKPVVSSGRAKVSMDRISVTELDFMNALAKLARQYHPNCTPINVHCFPPAKLHGLPVEPCSNATKLYIMPDGDIYIFNFMTSSTDRLGNCLIRIKTITGDHHL